MSCWQDHFFKAEEDEIKIEEEVSSVESEVNLEMLPDEETPRKKSGKKKNKVFVNESVLDVRYFNSDAPVKQVSTCIVSKDGTVTRLPRTPFYIVIQTWIRKIFRKNTNGRTFAQWFGMGATWFIVLGAIIGLVGLIAYVFAIFAED